MLVVSPVVIEYLDPVKKVIYIFGKKTICSHFFSLSRN